MDIGISILIAIIAAVPPTLAAILSWMSTRKNASKIQEIHLSINSRLTELLKLTAESSHASGVIEGKKDVV